MRNILVVECVSTGLNFIEDIIHRGYHPVVLNLKAIPGADLYAKLAADSLNRISFPFDRIEEKNTYEETLAEVKKCNPAVIVPGSEQGVILANRLAFDLGLQGNPIDRLAAMTKKDAMHEALKAAGLRYIMGKVVSSVAEAQDFCRENHLETAVVKPLQSSGSMGVVLCNNIKEVCDAVTSIIGSKSVYGYLITECLVQERIVGVEYIVNTISSNGKHRLSSVLRYEKVRTKEGGHIYNYCELVERLEPGISELINYALDTATAIGVQYGEIHGEYMVDKQGPVLIEVNCRPMGNSYPADYLNRCLGQHETDSILDAYLDPVKFALDAAKPYKTYCGCCQKFLMVPREIEAESMPIWVIAQNLRSTYLVAAATEDHGVIDLVKTIDLETNGGEIYLINDDATILRHDLELLCEIEKDYFGFLINDGMTHRLCPYQDREPENPLTVLQELDCHGTTLLIHDKPCEIKNCMCITPAEEDQAGTGFDNVVICLEKTFMEQKESYNLNLAFNLMKKAKKGGRVIFSKGTCDYMSYKRKGAELLLRVLGMEIEMTRSKQDNLAVIGRA